MRKAARRESAQTWLASGVQVTVKMYAKRNGVDRYTAREDLEAMGFVFAPGRHAMVCTPETDLAHAQVGTGTGQDPETCWIDGRLMFVVGYTPGGAPYGCYADELFS